MTECPEALKASQYHDDEMEESQRSAFEEHVKSCSECRSALRDYEALSDVCNTEETSLFSSEVERRVFLRNLHEGLDIGQNRARERFAYPLFAAAATLLFCTVSSSWMLLQNPTNLDNMTLQWVEYMVEGPGEFGIQPRTPGDNEENLTEWMTYALSEDYTND